MGLLKRTASAALGAALLFSACGAPDKGTSSDVVEPSVRTLKFQVSGTLGQEVVEQADAFSDFVAEISSGTLLVEVTLGMPDHETVARGDVDFAILSSAQMAQADSVFSMFSMPFLYNDFDHMGMALNSDRMLEQLEQRLEPAGLAPMAAFARNGGALVSSEAVRLPADFKDAVIAMRADNAVKLSAFEALGARVLPYTQPSVSGMLGQEVEVLPEDLRQPSVMVRVDTVEADLDQAGKIEPMEEDAPLYLMNSYHSISPLWLVGNRNVLSRLSKKERAMLREGCAELLAGADLQRKKQDDALLAQIRKSGMKIVDPERPDLALYLYGPRGEGSGSFQLPDYFEPSLYLLVQEYGV